MSDYEEKISTHFQTGVGEGSHLDITFHHLTLLKNKMTSMHL